MTSTMPAGVGVDNSLGGRSSRLWAVSRRRWPGIRRLGWGVLDQGASSLTNFAVTIVVARMLGAEQFGAFTLAYVTYAFALNASRGLATDPLMARFGGVDVVEWRRIVPLCTGTSIVVGVVAGLVVLGAGAVMQGPARGAFLALGLLLPGLMLQDSWRYAFFALGRGEHAFLNDVVWGVTLVPCLVVAARTGHATVFWFVLAWGAAATVAAGVGIVQARLLPRPARVGEWWKHHRDLGVRYLIEGTSSSLTTQLRTYAVGAILGLATVGYIQAANTLMGPFVIVLAGTSAVIVPEAARIVRRAPHRLPVVCLAFTAGLAAIVLLWGAVLLVALPRGLGDLLLGQIWRPTYPLVPLSVLILVGGSLQAGAGAGLHALQAARRSVRAMLITSGIHLVLGIGGAVLGGTTGTLIGTAVAAWLSAALWWWEFRAAQRGPVPASSRGRHRHVG